MKFRPILIPLLILINCFSVNYVKSQGVADTVNSPEKGKVHLDTVVNESGMADSATRPKVKESRRVVAVFLCITLGPFGMHRLYLGTEPQVAAAYSATLGGGFGFVAIVDLYFLVFSKDISRFRNNPRFIMWKEP